MQNKNRNINNKYGIMVADSGLKDTEIKSIAIFRALQLGDMLCIIPAVRALRNSFPRAKITLIGLSSQRDLVSRFSNYFDDFIDFAGWPGLPEAEWTHDGVMNFLADVQKRRFHMVLQMQGNGYIVNPMCMLFGARIVAGLRRDGDYCPDERLFPIHNEKEHEISRFIRVVEAVGARSAGAGLEYPVTDAEILFAKSVRHACGLSARPYICLHPGARDARRRWAACDFGRVGDALAARGFAILLTGSGQERDLLKEVQTCIHAPSVNLVEEYGHIGAGELAAVIAGSEGLVSNDTGVSHIAAAIRKRSVVIFSPYSDAARWAPLDRNLHHVILPEQASNVMYVINAVVNHLDITPGTADAAENKTETATRPA